MSLGKWVGIGAGWFFGGPIGAIIGYYIGKNFFNGNNDQEKAYEISLLILASLVIKADGKVVREELNYVKSFFTSTFGLAKANKYFEIFNTLNKQALSSQLRGVCIQLTQSINHASRLQIIHFLFGVASSDNEIHPAEINLINKIAGYLNINHHDLQSIYSMFLKNDSSIDKYYKILEIEKEVSTEEVKKAYRKLVMKYHPDKLQGVSDDIIKLANEKFLSIQDAYEKIIQHRS
jgi:DnaJ like chaperone protein